MSSADSYSIANMQSVCDEVQTAEKEREREEKRERGDEVFGIIQLHVFMMNVSVCIIL